MSQSRKQKILGDVKKARRRRTLATTGIVAILAVTVVLGIIFLTPRSPSSNALIGQPVSTTVQNQLTGVNSSTLVTVGSGGVTRLTSESGPLLTSGTKPEVLYIGAEYCPYCAAERWSLIVALSKFGNFSGLTYMLSADSPEVYPDTATFSFKTASYTSPYLAFVSVEEQDRYHSPLQSPTQAEQNLLTQYDPQGAIPFVDVGNFNVTYNGGSQFIPSALGGLNWTQIGSQLNNPNTSVAKSVDAGANTLISAICKIDGSAPSNVCNLQLNPLSLAPVQAINASLGDSHDLIIAGVCAVMDSSWKGPRQPSWL